MSLKTLDLDPATPLKEVAEIFRSEGGPLHRMALVSSQKEMPIMFVWTHILDGTRIVLDLEMNTARDWLEAGFEYSPGLMIRPHGGGWDDFDPVPDPVTPKTPEVVE